MMVLSGASPAPRKKKASVWEKFLRVLIRWSLNVFSFSLGFNVLLFDPETWFYSQFSRAFGKLIYLLSIILLLLADDLEKRKSCRVAWDDGKSKMLCLALSLVSRFRQPLPTVIQSIPSPSIQMLQSKAEMKMENPRVLNCLSMSGRKEGKKRRINEQIFGEEFSPGLRI